MHPVTYEVEFVAPRSRLTTFFRLLLAIPHLIVIALWGILISIVVVVAWIVIVVTGRYPAGLWAFTATFLVYYARVYSYTSLLTDPYPPFGAGGDYPVRLEIERPDRHSRLTTLFRLILVIPAYVAGYLLQIAGNAVSLLAWLVIVVTGRMPVALQGFIVFVHRFLMRLTAYGLLLVDAYPSFGTAEDAASGYVS
jgi:hypothetical protein